MPARVEPVWDLGVRLFHWALAILVATALWLGHYGPAIKTWHFYTGYAIGGLIVFRILWGFVGTRTARFASFVRGPGAILAYVPQLASRSPSHSHGHSPVAGISVLVGLALIGAQVITGLMADDEVFNAGPLARYVGEDWRLWATSWHVTGAWLLIGYIAVHLSAIAYYALWKRENLIRPMITGSRTIDNEGSQ